MGMYGSRAVTLLVLISDDVINRILKLDIQTNILVYVTRCCTDLTSKVLKERTFGQSSALLYSIFLAHNGSPDEFSTMLYVHFGKCPFGGEHLKKRVWYVHHTLKIDFTY